MIELSFMAVSDVMVPTYAICKNEFYSMVLQFDIMLQIWLGVKLVLSANNISRNHHQ